MADPFDIASWKSALFRVIAAQASNLSRIVEGATLDNGTEIAGITPDKIRLHDTPMRLQARPEYDEARLLITLGPLADNDGGGRSVQREDRSVSYLVVAGIGLSRPEQEQEESGEGLISLLARRCDAFTHDFKAVFRDNFHLQYPGCGGGLVDDHLYSIGWDPEVSWPKALVVVRVTATLYELA